jgi:hypothetical protein
MKVDVQTIKELTNQKKSAFNKGFLYDFQVSKGMMF